MYFIQLVQSLTSSMATTHRNTLQRSCFREIAFACVALIMLYARTCTCTCVCTSRCLTGDYKALFVQEEHDDVTIDDDDDDYNDLSATVLPSIHAAGTSADSDVSARAMTSADNDIVASGMTSADSDVAATSADNDVAALGMTSADNDVADTAVTSADTSE